MSDISPAAGVIQSDSALALPCDHGKKLAKINGTVTITIDFVHLETVIKEDDEYNVILNTKPLTTYAPFFLTHPFPTHEKSIHFSVVLAFSLVTPNVSLLQQLTIS